MSIGSPRRLAVAVGTGALVVLVVVLVAVATGSNAPTPPRSDADPYVAGFAQDLEGQVSPPLPPDQADEFEHGPNIGGCAIGYGLRGECVPYNFPPYVAPTYAARCAWLDQQGAQALEVPGEDRHRLVPPNGPVSPRGHPYACPNVLKPADGAGPP